jgi:glucose/arabinose dehydrogenase
MPVRISLLRPGLLLPALGVLLLAGAVLSRPRREPAHHAERPACLPDNGGLSLPKGLCALVVAHGIGAVRHLVVAPNGDVFVNRKSSGVLALRDTSGDGVADVTRSFGKDGGTGIALAPGFLYYSTNDAVYRYPWRPGQLEPQGDAEPIVTGLPGGGDHSAKSIALGPGGALFVNIGSATNSCQEQNRASRSPGHDPWTELETRAGIWRFAADKRGQRFADGERWATGLRNTVALAVDPGGGLYGVMLGRDQLADNWGFTPEKSAENPGEEMVRIERGDDYGWPYCDFDVDLGRNVLAPEYGGDGKQIGRCTAAKAPLLAFPGHWAPLAIAFGPARQRGPAYASGAFIAFHGSWNRAPLPQQGFRIVWQPMADGRPAGAYQTFATPSKNPTAIRPSGLAVGPDGSLYLTADESQTVWRIMNAAGAERTKEGT